MKDTDLTLVLTDGTDIDVVYPIRLGLEYETPWLNTLDRSESERHVGTREWNIDINEQLTKRRVGTARFIIGQWGSVYASLEGVQNTVYCDNVKDWHPLPPELQKQADDYRTIKRLAAEEEARLARHVTVADLEPLLEEIRKLKRLVVRLVVELRATNIK